MVQIVPPYLSTTATWDIIDGRIVLKAKGLTLEVTANDVVRAEFKDQEKVKGFYFAGKPSEHLENIKFNRFPAKFGLRLVMPSDKVRKPFLRAFIVSDRWKFDLGQIVETDQLLVDNNWFPVIMDDTVRIRDLFNRLGISKLGRINMRQAIDLILDESALEYVSISKENNDEHYSEVNACDVIEDCLSFSALEVKLYPYQKNGARWLYSMVEEGLGCILADEMGLGKTIQIIALLAALKPRWRLPSIVIAPATLLENWRREFSKFCSDMDVFVHFGSARTGFPSALKSYDTVITSYDTAVRDQSMLKMIDWGLVVLDEAQYIKNPETKRALAVKSLRRRAGISVTGTPLENRLLDIWSLMDFSCPGILGTKDSFESFYDDSKKSAEVIENAVTPLILRRRVADVFDDLPDKIVIPQAIYMKDNEIESYERLRTDILAEYGKSATLVALTRLRQFCAHPGILNTASRSELVSGSAKYARFIDILEEIFQWGQKAIVFTSFSVMSDLISADIIKRFNVYCNQIDGRTPAGNRQSIVDGFSSVAGPGILILNPKAAGTGLNITCANHVIHYNLEWNPAVEDQATARAYRLGQKLPVFVYRLFYSGSVEEIVNDRIERKRDLAETAVIGTASEELEAADISKALRISPSMILTDNM